MENQGTNEDDSQSDPHPEAGIFCGQTTQNTDLEECCDNSILVFWMFSQLLQKFVQDFKYYIEVWNFTLLYRLSHYYFRVANSCFFLDGVTLKLLFAHCWFGEGSFKPNLYFFFRHIISNLGKKASIQIMSILPDVR